VEQSLGIRGAGLTKSPDIGRIYAELGRRVGALRVLEERIANSGPNDAEGIARIYFALGDRERGFKWLTRAFDDRAMLVFIKFDPRFDVVRSDPRFTRLVAWLNIPDPK